MQLVYALALFFLGAMGGIGLYGFLDKWTIDPHNPKHKRKPPDGGKLTGG